MERQKILVILAALIVATFFTVLVYHWQQSKPNAPAQQIAVDQDDVSVLVAARDLNIGKKLQADDLAWKVWPTKAISPMFIIKKTRTKESLVDAVVRSPIAAGEPLIDNMVVHPGHLGYLAGMLEPGMRAYTFEVDRATGSAGFVLPGDRVDIILTENNGGRTFNSSTILHDIQILGVDQMTVNDTRNQTIVSKTITVEVSPEQAELLSSSRLAGTLSVALTGAVSRTHEPEVKQPTPTIAAVPPPAPKTNAQITEIRGAQVQENTLSE